MVICAWFNGQRGDEPGENEPAYYVRSWEERIVTLEDKVRRLEQQCYPAS